MSTHSPYKWVLMKFDNILKTNSHSPNEILITNFHPLPVIIYEIYGKEILLIWSPLSYFMDHNFGSKKVRNFNLVSFERI